jgi:hypothetical protein
VIAGLVLRQFLFGLSPVDPATYALVALLLCVAALAATTLPVHRALTVDPAATLRAE